MFRDLTILNVYSQFPIHALLIGQKIREPENFSWFSGVLILVFWSSDTLLIFWFSSLFISQFSFFSTLIMVSRYFFFHLHDILVFWFLIIWSLYFPVFFLLLRIQKLFYQFPGLLVMQYPVLSNFCFFFSVVFFSGDLVILMMF